MTVFSAAIACLFVLLGWSSSALAQARVALMIGNQGYGEKIGPLKNPHQDIALVGAALERLAFKVTTIKDADYRSIDAAIKRHIQAVRREGQGAISFIYYSGHGAADPDTKTNYLIPIDVANADDEDLWNYSLNLNKIIEILREQAPAATHYVVFDACRNELNLVRKGKKAFGEKGFLPIAYTPGVMVAYSTAPGRTATDVGSDGAPYARALSDEIGQAGVEAMSMFRRVALRVNRETGQDPWISASTLPEVYFAGRAPLGPTAEQQIEIAFWNSVKDSKSPEVLATYLARYPKGQFLSDARALIEQRKAERAESQLELKRQEEARATAEMKRLEQEQTVREAADARERDSREGANGADTHKALEQQRAALQARVEELNKAREEARLAQDAAKRAEEQRAEAVKAAKIAKAAAARTANTSPTPALTKGSRSCSTLRGECNRVCLVESPGLTKEQCASVCNEKFGACLQTGTFVRNRRPTEHNLVRK